MAKVVVLQGHASSNSFTQALSREFVRAIREGHTVQEFNAYETDLPFADPTRIQHRGETTYPALKEASLAVASRAMTLGGGAAYGRRGGLERIFRDAQAASVMAPTTDVLKDFLGKACLGLPLF